jgi:hypothetical protein
VTTKKTKRDEKDAPCILWGSDGRVFTSAAKILARVGRGRVRWFCVVEMTPKEIRSLRRKLDQAAWDVIGDVTFELDTSPEIGPVKMSQAEEGLPGDAGVEG